MPRETLEQIIELAVTAAARGIRVMVPASVLSVNAPRGRVSVRLELTRPRTDPELEPDTDPPVVDVPVALPSTVTQALNFALAVGDRGYVAFADFGLGTWLQGDGAERVTPHIGEAHGLAGAVFVPGLWPNGAQVAIRADGLELGDQSGDATLEVVSGEVRMGRGATEAALLGNQYIAAEKTWLLAMNTYLAAESTWAGVVGALFPGPTATFVAAIAAFVTATSTFTTTGGASVATIAKVK